jgi:hypothetical protein
LVGQWQARRVAIERIADVESGGCAGTWLAKPSAMLRLALVSLAATTLLACGEQPYDESWGNDEIPTGKADGLLDGAEVLDFGEVGTGYVEGEQMDVYAIDLRGGDKITAVMTVTSGNLSPHFTLYEGASTYIGSDTFKRETKKITKTYSIDETGRHYVAVRAYQNTGAGKYSFKITCTGGPCAGEPVVDTLEVEEQVECIEKARVCSFAALPQWNGAVGAVRARSIFETCLGQVMTDDDGLTCTNACEGEQARHFCDAVIDALPFYADQSSACIAELDSCLDDCWDSSWDSSWDELWDSPQSVCWQSSLNGNCDTYARGHEKCGGTYADDSNEECHALCESTTGAFVDDLDLICVERCD